MANLLERYGLTSDDSKSFSISFIDGFMDCSYKSFLTYFMGIRPVKTDIKLTFGKGCHLGLENINKLTKEVNLPCYSCKHDCKVNTPQRINALEIPIEECGAKQIMRESFLLEFNEEFEELALSNPGKNKTMEDVQNDLEKHHQWALNCMSDAIFRTQPIGTVVYTEQKLRGDLMGHIITGVLDLVLGIEQEGKINTLIMDYKTAAQEKRDALPLRQLAMYTHMLEQVGLPVNGIGALYMYKKNKPVKKTNKPFQQSRFFFHSIDQNRELLNNTLLQLKEDIDNIKYAISNGVFLKNRQAMYCLSCDHKEYCDNPKLLERMINSGLTNVRV